MRFVPRTCLVDLERGIMDLIKASLMGALFQADNMVKANFLDGKRKIQLDVNGHDIITGAAKIECLSSERERERETILALEIVIYGSVSSSVRISHNVLNQKGMEWSSLWWDGLFLISSVVVVGVGGGGGGGEGGGGGGG
eukprot:642902_1